MQASRPAGQLAAPATGLERSGQPGLACSSWTYAVTPAAASRVQPTMGAVLCSARSRTRGSALQGAQHGRGEGGGGLHRRATNWAAAQDERLSWPAWSDTGRPKGRRTWQVPAPAGVLLPIVRYRPVLAGRGVGYRGT